MGIFVSSSFTVGSDITLASYSPEVGGSFVLHPSYSGSVLVDASLDRAYLNSAGAAAYYATGSPASADYEVQMDFSRPTQIAANVSLILGMDTSADTGVMLRLNDTGVAAQWEVMDRVAGSNTILNGGTAVSGASTPSVGGAAVTARMVRSGTTITVFLNGVQETVLTSTTSLTAIGKVGIRCSGQSSSTTGIHMDNLSATQADAPPTGGPSFRPNKLRPAIFKPGRAR